MIFFDYTTKVFKNLLPAANKKHTVYTVRFM